MRPCIVLTLIALGFLLAGCGDPGPGPENPTAEATMSPAELDAAVAALLVKADLADETEDRVVELCLTCRLGMQGSAEHALQARGYEIHFCSESCKEHAAEDIDKAILALGELEPAPTETTQ